MKSKKLRKLIASQVRKTVRSRKPKKEAQVAPLKVITGGKAAPAKIRMETLARARTPAPKKTGTPDINPFQIYTPPPGVLPPGQKPLAMDTALTQSQLAWAGQSIGAYWQEGLTFLGYAYLSELTLRPEYRVISQVIATEMTRKWIKIQAVSETEEDETPVPESKIPPKDPKPAFPFGNGGSSNGATDAEPNEEDLKQAAQEEPDPADQDQEDPVLADPEDQEIQPGEEGEPGEGEEELAGIGHNQGPALDDKSEKIKELEDELDRLQVRDVFYKLAEMDGWMGRVHLYIDTGDTDKPQELLTDLGDGRNEVTKAKFKKGSLKRIAMIEPVWTYPQNYNATDPLKEDWYLPSQWFVMGKQVHSSRLLTFVGRPVPDILKPAYAFGGLSLSQIAKPYIDNWLQTRSSVNDIIRAFSVMVLQTDLTARLQNGDDDLFTRVDLFNALRDNRGTFVVDKEGEDFKNVSAPLSSLDSLQAQAQEHMAAVSRIPLVKLLGISPHGLNASSEGELKAFYDTINSFQEFFFRPHLTKVIHFAMMNLWGEIDEEITFKFEDLWAMTEKEQAEVEKIRAETGDILINGSNAITPAEERKRVANSAETPYEGLDVENVPEPPEQPDMGLGGKPGLNVTGHKPFDPGLETGESEQQNAEEAGDDRIIPFGEDAEWNENDHPRDKDGEFSSGGSGGGKASLNPKELKKVGPQMGSNPGGIYEDKSGKRFHVKQSQSPEHARNEKIAAALYGLTGASTLKYVDAGKNHVATELEKLDKKKVSQLSPAEIKEVQKDFATHAWLANWDAAGLGGDNIGTINGKPVSLDLGGAMEYRAQGKPKGQAFGTKVGELTTLRDPKMNPDAARVFGSMSKADLQASARRVIQVPDQEIRKTVESGGGSPELAQKLIARKADIAKSFGLSPAAGDQELPGEGGLSRPSQERSGMPGAAADAGWSESDHPRVPSGEHGGEFTKGGGGGGSGGAKSEGGAYAGQYVTTGSSPKENHALTVVKVLNNPTQKGIHYRRMLAKLIKEAPGFGGASAVAPLKAKLIDALDLTAKGLVKKGKAGEAHKVVQTLIKMGAHEDVIVPLENSISKAMGGQPELTAPAKKKPTPQVKAPAGSAPLGLSPPAEKPGLAAPKPPASTAGKSAAEIVGTMPLNEVNAAKKTSSYYPVPITKEGKKIAEEFNAKWANKPINTPEAIVQKVADYKEAKAKIAKAEEEAVAEAQKKAQAEAEQQAEKQKEEAKKQAAANKQLMADLGINEQEAVGFGALAQMIGGKKADVVNSFKHYEQEAKNLGYPITGFQAALIKNYSGSGYAHINPHLRNGSWTEAQHVYVKMVNNALKKMPTYKGICRRGTSLAAEHQAKYKVGHIVPENAFMSTTTKGQGFGGNTNYVITAIGKRGASIKQLSSHPSENEVLFAARTFFKVTKVEGSPGGQMTVHLEEMDDD